MQSVHSGMTKRVLADVLSTQFGIEPPVNTTKQAILDLLAEAGCLVTPDPSEETKSNENMSNDEVKKEPRYVVNIFKQKGEKGAVTGCINGKAFALPRGKDIEISKAIYEVLTKGAIKLVGDPIDGGGVEIYKQQSYPLTLVEVIT